MTQRILGLVLFSITAVSGWASLRLTQTRPSGDSIGSDSGTGRDEEKPVVPLLL
jgi:hypothetical protein